MMSYSNGSTLGQRDDYCPGQTSFSSLGCRGVVNGDQATDSLPGEWRAGQGIEAEHLSRRSDEKETGSYKRSRSAKLKQFLPLTRRGREVWG